MKEDIKKKWVEALRSGEPEQAQGVLNNGKGGFCCLGVLTDLYAKEKGLKWTRRQMGVKMLEGTYHAVVAPQCVVEWASLPDHNPDIDTEEKQTSLAELNDDGATFEEIADIIENQL